MTAINEIYSGDALTLLAGMDTECFHTCVTSPPYWMLRNYKTSGQYGMEPTPEEYVAKQVEVFRQVRRVLRADGTLWLNIGDSYANAARKRTEAQVTGANVSGYHIHCKDQGNKIVSGIKRKELVGIPWMLAFALRADGWYLRQDIIWHKPNPMPESVNDRCTKSHEYLFLLTKSEKYYYDAAAIATPYQEKTLTTYGASRHGYGDATGLIAAENWAARAPVRKPKNWKTPDGWDTASGTHGNIHRHGREKGHKNKNESGTQHLAANRRSVWTMATQGYKGAHYATMPEQMAALCILAGSPEGGLVFDPYMGAGTTAVVAKRYHRDYIGTELNPQYIKDARARIAAEPLTLL